MLRVHAAARGVVVLQWPWQQRGGDILGGVARGRAMAALATARRGCSQNGPLTRRPAVALSRRASRLIRRAFLQQTSSSILPPPNRRGPPTAPPPPASALHLTCTWMAPASVEPRHRPSLAPIATSGSGNGNGTANEHDNATLQEPDVGRPQRNSVIPPYWRRHERNLSRLSSYSSDTRPAPIGLEDHTDEGSEQCKVLWAKAVTIDDYVVVSGTAPGLGAYVVWNCTVETLEARFRIILLHPWLTGTQGGPMKIRKRYSEFEELRAKLVQSFPHAVGSMPQFPPKSVVCKSATCTRSCRRMLTAQRASDPGSSSAASRAWRISSSACASVAVDSHG